MSDEAEDATEEEPTDTAPGTSHALLRRVIDLAQLTGDHPESPPVDYSSWGSWLPEPECEKKYVAYRRIQREGMVREVMFEEAKKFYRHALTKMRGQKLFEGSLSDVAFYLALRHFPPQ